NQIDDRHHLTANDFDGPGIALGLVDGLPVDRHAPRIATVSVFVDLFWPSLDADIEACGGDGFRPRSDRLPETDQWAHRAPGEDDYHSIDHIPFPLHRFTPRVRLSRDEGPRDSDGRRPQPGGFVDASS